jgi:hypothetical protein
MTENTQKTLKARCFFANMRFHPLVCDSNHKKSHRKPSTMTSHRTIGLLYWEIICFYLIFIRGKSMNKSYDQTFRLTTSLLTPDSSQKTTARIPLSALTPVRSVECGRFA